MKTKVIEVMERDIDKGIPGDCLTCPVARAVRRAFKKGEGKVAVLEGYYTGRLPLINIGRMEIEAPESVINFVKAFDKGRVLKPFTFELEY